MAKVNYSAVGRRKKAVARVRLVAGEGKIVINKRDIDNYFGLETLKMPVRQPLTPTLTVSSGWDTGTKGTGAEVPIFTSNNGKINLNQAGLNGEFQNEIIDSVTNVNNNPSVTPPSDPTPTEAIWEGTENSSWDNPNNWNTGAVLDGSMSIIIDGAATPQPEINSNVSITFTDENKITFKNDATLTIGNSGSLTIDSEKFDFRYF